MTKFLDEAQRKEHGIEAENARLILPGEDEDLSKMFEPSGGKVGNDDEEEIKEERYQGGGMSGKGQMLMGGRREEDLGNNESQYNIDETNESFSERKNQTNIPSLKNNKNAMNKATRPFSERLLSGEMKIDPSDPYLVAN